MVINYDDELNRPLATAKASWAIDPRLGVQAQNLAMHKTVRDCFDGTPLKAACDD
jgi:hypothetical protein